MAELPPQDHEDMPTGRSFKNGNPHSINSVAPSVVGQWQAVRYEQEQQPMVNQQPMMMMVAPNSNMQAVHAQTVGRSGSQVVHVDPSTGQPIMPLAKPGQPQTQTI